MAAAPRGDPVVGDGPAAGRAVGGASDSDRVGAAGGAGRGARCCLLAGRGTPTGRAIRDGPHRAGRAARARHGARREPVGRGARDRHPAGGAGRAAGTLRGAGTRRAGPVAGRAARSRRAPAHAGRARAIARAAGLSDAAARGTARARSAAPAGRRAGSAAPAKRTRRGVRARGGWARAGAAHHAGSGSAGSLRSGPGPRAATTDRRAARSELRPLADRSEFLAALHPARDRSGRHS